MNKTQTKTRKRVQMLVYLLPILAIASEITLAGECSSSAFTNDYTLEQFDEDVSRLIPLVGALKGQCLSNNDQVSCDQADSVMRVLHSYVYGQL